MSPYVQIRRRKSSSWRYSERSKMSLKKNSPHNLTYCTSFFFNWSCVCIVVAGAPATLRRPGSCCLWLWIERVTRSSWPSPPAWCGCPWHAASFTRAASSESTAAFSNCITNRLHSKRELQVDIQLESPLEIPTHAGNPSPKFLSCSEKRIMNLKEARFPFLRSDSGWKCDVSVSPA